MTYFKIFLFIFIHCIVTQARISDKRLCADPNCSEPISLAKTLITYNSDDRQILSFPKNVPVKIFSKAAGSRSDLWGAEIDGKRGYVPMIYVRETKVFKKDLPHLVPTDDDEINNSASTIPSEVPKTKSAETVPVTEQISPNSVSAPYEVIDGTTVYFQSANEEVSPSANVPGESTVEPVLSVTPDPRMVYNNLNSNINTVKVKETVDKEQTDKQIENKENVENRQVENKENVENKQVENKEPVESKQVKNKEPVKNTDGGVFESISKFIFKDNDDVEVSNDDDDDEEYVDDEEGLSEDDEEIEEVKETNKSEEKNTSASITDKILDANGEKSIEIDSGISNTNSTLKQNEEIIASSIKSGENMDQQPGSGASQLLQNDVAKPVENNVVEASSTQTSEQNAAVPSAQNAEKMVENPSKEPDYKDFYGVPSNFLRNSFHTLPKASAEVTDQQQKVNTVSSEVTDQQQVVHSQVTDQQQVDTVHSQVTDQQQVNTDGSQVTDQQQANIVSSQVPDTSLPPVVTEPPPVESQTEFTTPTPAVHEIPVPIDTFTEPPVTQNPLDVQDSNQSSEQKNELINNNSTKVNNVQEIIHNTTDEKLNSNENSEQLVYGMENMKNLTSPEVENSRENSEQPKENIENNEQVISAHILEPEHTTENVISQEVNKTDEEVINNSAENSQEFINGVENIEQPELNINLNSTSIENNIQDNTLPENNIQDNTLPENNIQENSSIENNIQENKLTENNIQENLSIENNSEENTLADNNIQENTIENNIPPESSIENTDLNSEEIIEEFVTVSEESAEKVEVSDQNSNQVEEIPEQSNSEGPGFFANMYSSIFGSPDEPSITEDSIEENKVSEEPAEEMSLQDVWNAHAQEKPADKYTSLFGERTETPASEMQSCQVGQDPSACPLQHDYTEPVKDSTFELPDNAYSIFLYLSLTSITLLLFILGYYYIEKKRTDGSLVVSINNLEKNLLISSKECLLLQDELNSTKERLSSIEDSSFGSNEMVTALKAELEEAKNVKLELEEQITNLEKELENATEAGMELNRMLREVLGTQSGNEHLMQNIEHLQKQLNEQQMTINSMNSTLGVKTTENELLQTELSVAHEKIVQLQGELDKMVMNLLSVQEEKCKSENDFEEQTRKLKNDFDSAMKSINGELNVLKDENAKLKSAIDETQRALDVKNNEYALLKEGMKDVQAVQSNKDSLKALLDVSKVKAEVQQLRQEKHKMAERFQAELEAKQLFEKEVQVMMQEVQILKDKFEEAEREKVEAQTRLEVLSGYFKEKEAQLQKEINENESKWMQKEGEATSTIERIKWIQEELQNYKSQNELLKKEILDQEVSLKSQISMLEKKSHDNWLLARQAERRLEESKQEASQLRNRLTIVEKNLNNTSQAVDESKMQNRIMSPLESNGEIPVSPLHMGNVENPGSPPLMFPHRDHMTTSPPIPGLPPFMPPPPGVPFMPPPMPGVPPFMPPPPALFPGDHRPPPLGRMSSPPLYSPDSRPYSPYDRDDSPPLSPTYTDSDYRRRSPPPPPSSRHMPRNYSPYNSGKGRQSQWEDEREYRGQQHRNKPRTHKGPGLSSGSGNSNESLDNSGRHSGRI